MKDIHTLEGKKLKVFVALILPVGTLLFLFVVQASSVGAADPHTLSSLVYELRDEVVASTSNWDGLIKEVADAQDAGKKPSQYQGAYDTLMAVKAELVGYAGQLAGFSADIQKYRTERPDLSETEERQLSDVMEAIDSLQVILTSYLLRIGDIEVKHAVLMGELSAEERKVEPELDVRGELSVLTGDGTLTDRDRYYLYVTERYKNSDEEIYTFYQKYENDHSFIDRRRMAIGFSQEIPSFLGGELNMRQDYENYDDLTTTANSRRELALGLDFARPFAGGRTQTFFSYQYYSKNYSGVSPRSYLNNRASFELTHELSPRVIGNAYWRMIDSHYALANTNGYNATYLGAGFQFLPREDLIWNLSYQSLENSYDVRKASAYFEEYFLLEGRYQPNNVSYLEGDLRLLEHNRRRTPASSYDENRFRLSYGTALGDNADGDFRFEWRDKNFDVASGSDYDHLRWQAYFNFYPKTNLRWYYNFDLYDYDYSSILRSYKRMYNRLGLNYRFDNGVLMTTEFALTDQNYSANTSRNYTIRDFLADLYFPLANGNSLRFFLTLSRLNQSAIASVNDYSATDLGLEYDWRVSENYRLRFIYTYDRRNYKRQADIKDSAFEARLNFQF